MTEKDVIKISVKDNGQGIKSHDQKRLFKIFGRLDTQNRTEGIGLGLAICYEICAGIKAKIGLKSEWGKGSTFYMTMSYEGGSRPMPIRFDEDDIQEDEEII